jgi:NTE family protein
MAIRRPTIGLALGSGVARGWAHIGVLQALAEAGLEPDVVVGTSIGALVGGVHLAGRLSILETWARGLSKRSMWRFLDLRLSGGGLVGGARLAEVLDQNLGAMAIESLGKRFAAVATDLSTGHEIWVRDGSLATAIRASYALPGVFTPVQIDGRFLVDGALVNPVPVSVCRALGARLVIAVNLNADVFGKSRVQSALHAAEAGLFESGDGLSRLKPQALLARQLFGHGRSGPSLFTVMVGSLNIVQDRLSRSRLAGDPPDVTVAPRLGHIGLLEFDRADELIAEGRAAVDRTLPFLRDALAVIGAAEMGVPEDDGHRAAGWDRATD